MPALQLPKVPLPTEAPLWHFAVSLWRNPHTADAALALQARGWVVSHLLVAAFAAQEGCRWDGREPEAIRRWRVEATAGLRKLRKALPKERQDLSRLRQGLAQAELEAERIELDWWYQHLQQQPLPKASQGPVELLAHNLAAAGTLSTPVMELLADFALVLVTPLARDAFILELQANLDPTSPS